MGRYAGERAAGIFSKVSNSAIPAEEVRNHANRTICVMRNLLVRPVQKRDYEEWLPLWDGYNAFYGRTGPTALAADISWTTWLRFFDTKEPVFALVAESDGMLLGLAHFLYHRSTSSIASVCYLQDLFTKESARGKGVATALIHEVYRQAQAAKASRVYWHTHETNATAQQVYNKVAERSGFIVYRHLL